MSYKSGLTKHESEFLKLFPRSTPPSRDGWPDFWWVDRFRRFCACTIISAGSPLFPVQYRVLTLLHKQARAAVYTWTQVGLSRFTPRAWEETDDAYWPVDDVLRETKLSDFLVRDAVRYRKARKGRGGHEDGGRDQHRGQDRIR